MPQNYVQPMAEQDILNRLDPGQALYGEQPVYTPKPEEPYKSFVGRAAEAAGADWYPLSKSTVPTPTTTTTLPTIDIEGAAPTKQAINPNDLVLNPNAKQAQEPVPIQSLPAGISYDKIIDLYNKGHIAMGESLDIRDQAADMLPQMSESRKTDQEKLRELREGKINEDGLKEQGYNDRFEQIMKEMDEEYDSMKDARIDSGRFFNNMGTGRKIILALGLAISGMSKDQGKTAISMVNKAIDRDIASQKQEIASKRLGLKGKANRLAMLTQKFKSEEMAVLAEGNFQRLKVKDAIDAKLAKATTQKERGGLLIVQADLLKNLRTSQQKMKALSKEQMQNEIAYKEGSPVAQKIAQRWKHDPKAQREAMKETGIKEKMDFAIARIGEMYDKFKDAGTLGSNLALARIPKTMASDLENQAKADIISLIVPIWKGPMSDVETALFDPFIPAFSISDERLDNMKRKVIDKMLMNGKPTPYLDELGIKRLNLKELEPNIKSKKGK